MGNKVKYNLKNVHAAKLTETIPMARPPFRMRSRRQSPAQ